MMVETALSLATHFFDWMVDDGSALLTALATVAIAILTFQLANENRRLREAGTEPKVVAYISPHPDGNGGVNIVFANVGSGPALDFSFKFQCDWDDFKRHRVLVKDDAGRTAINVLPQGEKITAIFGVGFVLFGKVDNEQIEPLKKFQVELSYSDLNGKKRSNRSEIDIQQFAGLAGMSNRPALREIEATLKKIERRFGVVANASEKFVRFVDSTKLSDQYTRIEKGDDGDG